MFLTFAISDVEHGFEVNNDFSHNRVRVSVTDRFTTLILSPTTPTTIRASAQLPSPRVFMSERLPDASKKSGIRMLSRKIDRIDVSGAHYSAEISCGGDLSRGIQTKE